jgi:hypothetical protein
MTRLFRAVCLLVVWVLLSGCADDSYRLPNIQLRYGTAIERRASLSVLRRTWAERPEVVSPGASLYERALMNRAAYFGRKVKGTESYRAACDFWMACVQDHITRYEEDASRFGK